MSEPRDPRKAGGPPPVEPLSDVAWARVERKVWAELDAAEAPARLGAPPARRSARVAWIAGGAALAVAAGALLLLSRGGGERAAGAPRDGGVGMAASRVVTEDGASQVSFGDARITVAPRSAVVMSGGADTGVLVVLERGGARFEVAPREDRPKFVVQAGDVSVRVIGTVFGVERDGERARVEVFRGTVEVVAPGETARVHAGERWPVETAEAAPAAAAAPAPAPAAEPAPAPAAAPAPAPTPAPAAPHGHAAAPRPAGDPTAQRFAEAAALEATDPAAALGAYERVALGDGPWAANALYAAARLRYDRKEQGEARALLQLYLRRFPRGANAADARALLDRLTSNERTTP